MEYRRENLVGCPSKTATHFAAAIPDAEGAVRSRPVAAKGARRG